MQQCRKCGLWPNRGHDDNVSGLQNVAFVSLTKLRPDEQNQLSETKLKNLFKKKKKKRKELMTEKH